MRIAAIADTHGNIFALHAVLADIRKAAPDLIVNLGDLVSGPFNPVAAADMQIELKCPTIAGNHERQLFERDTGQSDAYARPLLSTMHWHWLGQLPKTLTLLDGTVFACHGSPGGGDLDYLLEDVSSGRAVLADDDAIRPRLSGIGEATLVLCAHTHVARAALIDGVLVVNPGSVGLPAYFAREPRPHRMESGTPHARYALLTERSDGWAVDLRSVVYPWGAAAGQALMHGRADVAHWVDSGRASFHVD